MVRITTNGILRGYRSNLNRSTWNLSKARDTVLTQRNFTKFADDPALASQAFQMRTAYSRTNDQINTNEGIIKKFQSAQSSLLNIKSRANTANESVLKALNAPTASARQALGQDIAQIAEGMMQSMNIQYGDNFVFNGSNSLKVPFELKDGKVLYNGLDVSDPANQAALEKLQQEHLYLDVGLGLQEVNGVLVESTAFDSSIPGIDVLGFGRDADGDPKNMVAILSRLGEIFSGAGQADGALSESDLEEANRLQLKLTKAQDNFTTQTTKYDSKSKFLETNLTRLKETRTTLNEQIMGAEQVDLADAITTFSWAQYAYNAALKVGNEILSQSFIDFMR